MRTATPSSLTAWTPAVLGPQRTTGRYAAHPEQRGVQAVTRFRPPRFDA
jgi:hypothetical protein